MSDVTKVLIAQLKMAYIHKTILILVIVGKCVNLVARIQNCMSHTSKPEEKIIIIDGLSFFHIKYPATESTLMVCVGLVNDLRRLLK